MRLSLRQDIVGIGALLSSTPDQFSPDNIVELVHHLRQEGVRTEREQKQYEGATADYLGVSEQESQLLWRHFVGLIRPYGDSIGSCDVSEHKLALYGMFLLLQLLSQSVSSTVSHRKSNLSETWPSSLNQRVAGIAQSPLLRATSEVTLQKSPFMSHGDAQGLGVPQRRNRLMSAPASVKTGQSLSSVIQQLRDLPAGGHASLPNNAPSPYNGGQHPMTPPSSRGHLHHPRTVHQHHSPQAASRLTSIVQSLSIPEQSAQQWLFTPMKSHLHYMGFQIQFLLTHVSTIARICLAAASTTKVSLPSFTGSTLEAGGVDGAALVAVEFLISVEEHFSILNFHSPNSWPLLNCTTLFDLVFSLSKMLRDIAADPAAEMDDPNNTVHNGVHKKTLVHDHTLGPQHNFFVVNSFSSNIYASSAMGHSAIVHVSNSSVFLGAVGGILMIKDCSSVVIVAAAHTVHISNCKDCVLHLFTETPPLLVGNNRNLQLAPFNANYPGLLDDAMTSGLDPEAQNCWDKPTVAGTLHAIAMPSPVVSLLPARDLHSFAVPYLRAPTTPLEQCFPLPPVYAEVLEQREALLVRARERLKEAPDPMEAEALLIHEFKTWLMASGNHKQIEDLVAIDMHHGSAFATTL